MNVQNTEKAAGYRRAVSTSNLAPAATAVAALLAAASASAAPVIHNIGLLPGGTFTQGSQVSADGTMVTGYGDLNHDEQGTGWRAFRWTLGGGIQNLGVPSGLSWTAGGAISATGNAVVGNAANRPFRWTSSGGIQNLGLLPGGTLGLAMGVSGDGSVVVGYGNTAGSFWGFRWTSQTGMQVLGGLPGATDSSANAVSANGTTIVGVSGWSGTGSRAFRWTSSGIQNLGVLFGGESSFANAVNHDGTVVAGESDYVGDEQWGRRAFRWTQAGMLNLGVPSGAATSRGLAVNFDGKVVVGSCSISGSDRAAYWSAGTGMVNLNAYLASLGTNLTGWVLTEARGVSADGSAISGTGTFNGQTRAFLVTGLPCTSTANITAQPAPQTICSSGFAAFSVSTNGPGSLSYQWQFSHAGEPGNWQPVAAGLNSSSSNIPLFSALNPQSSVMMVSPIQAFDSSNYLRFRVVISNNCGNVTSSFANLFVLLSDFNCDGQIDFFDYLDFIQAYSNDDPTADFNRDGQVDFFDYLDFVEAYSAGR